MDTVILGLDVGTSKVAAVLEGADKKQLASSSRPHGAGLAGAPGRSEQDPAAILQAAQAVVGELPAELRSKVRAIGLSGQMHGVLLVGGNGEALSNLITWQDQRCLEEPDFLDELRRRTRHPLRTGYGCATLAWLRSHGLLPLGAVACTIYDWIGMRLAGARRAVIDPTSAASWGLFDLKTLCWDARAVSAAGFPSQLLPEVLPCGSNAGRLSPAFAAALGLSPSIPIAVGLGDSQASLLATLSDPQKELSLTLGTGGQLAIVAASIDEMELRAGESRCEYWPFPGGRFALVAASLCGGSAWAWLAEAVASWLRELGLPEPDRDELYRMLNELGLRASSALEVAPQFLGERYDPHLRGTVRGIELENFTLGNLARGLALGIMKNLKDMLPARAFAGRSRLVASGNALRLNPLLRKSAEEVFRLPLTMPEAGEEAAAGAALNASGLTGSSR